MNKICLFAGTSEGRKMAEFLSRQDTDLTVCVATEYGGDLLDELENVRISRKRLSAEEILRLLSEEQFDLVIDATHPYAEQVTENICNACSRTGTAYKRLLRDASTEYEQAVTVPDTAEAVSFLNTTVGNILLTTGSKEIGRFSGIRDFSERVFARVLPLGSSLDACSSAGLSPSHIIAMQGPFSEEMNSAMIRAVNAKWLVTKDSGKSGGFAEKAAAAAKNNIHLLVIGRPPQQEGLSEAEMYAFLGEAYGFLSKPRVTIIGTGPGDPDGMTLTAIDAIRRADCLIGSRRALETAAEFGKRTFEAVSEKEIAGFIHTQHDLSDFAVLMSGDSGFFSGTKRLLPLLSDCETKVIPGISSLSYLCAILRIPNEDICPVSLHGRSHGILNDIRTHAGVFVLTGGENSVDAICRQLAASGFGNLRVHVGERLSYADERIVSGTADEFQHHSYDPLSVMLIENENADPVVTHGLPDECFLRQTGERGIIPMTRSEIRSVSLSKLRLTDRSVCWDFGAGTGSVSIEMAMQAKKGHIYAVERDEKAAGLIRENMRRMAVENITVIEGTAPDACLDLPTPTHVFIGGSAGRLREIMDLLSGLNADIRITATAITLNAVSELTAVLNEYPVSETDVVMIQAARGKQAGEYKLMLGENPVYIFTMCLSGRRQ